MKRENIKEAADLNERLIQTEEIIEALNVAQGAALGEATLELHVPFTSVPGHSLTALQHYGNLEEQQEVIDLFICLKEHFAVRQIKIEKQIKELE